MIKASVFYPNGEGTTFDHDYYKATHVPMCVEAWSPLKAEIDKGLDGQPNAHLAWIRAVQVSPAVSP